MIPDLDRRFWEIIDASYTQAEYTALVRRCREAEDEINHMAEVIARAEARRQ
jgi:hypothetical protein